MQCERLNCREFPLALRRNTRIMPVFAIAVKNGLGQKSKAPDFAASSVSDRIAFADSSSRNRTAHVPAGEKAGRGPPCRRAVRSLQSGLRMKYCGIRACFAHFAGTGGGLCLQFRLRGGEGGIRTPDTFSGMPVFKTGAINHSATSPATAVGPIPAAHG